MNIIVTGNPVDGFKFIGPFPEDVEIPERHTDGLDYWWIAPLSDYDSTVTIAELTEVEGHHLDDFADAAEAAIEDFDLHRDLDGRVWAEYEATMYDLTNGVIPPTE